MGYELLGDEDSVSFAGRAGQDELDSLGNVDSSSGAQTSGDGDGDGDESSSAGGTSDAGGGSGNGGGSKSGSGSSANSGGGDGSGGDASGGSESGGASGSGAASGSGGSSSGGASSGGTSSGGTSSGGTSSGGTSSGGTGSTDFDPTDGYFELDASDSGGQNWVPSTLVFTSSSTNPDGTIDVAYRIDWFETTTFGILLGGEEVGVGTYDPMTALLSFDQTGGWSSNPLDHYDATYEPATGSLVQGSWATGNAGTFTGAHRLSGMLLAAPSAQSSSARNGLGPANMVDTDMMTYWSSANGRTVGETITLTLSAARRLRGLRLLSVVGANEAAPARLTVTSRDAGASIIDTSDITVPTDSMWNPTALIVDGLVSEVLIEITEVQPAAGNRVVVSGIELFGQP